MSTHVLPKSDTPVLYARGGISLIIEEKRGGSIPIILTFKSILYLITEALEVSKEEDYLILTLEGGYKQDIEISDTGDQENLEVGYKNILLIRNRKRSEYSRKDKPIVMSLLQFDVVINLKTREVEAIENIEEGDASYN